MGFTNINHGANIVIVTSFGPEGYVSYGRSFLNTYFQCHNKMPLVVYVEGADQQAIVKTDFPNPELIVRDLLQIPGAAQMLEMIGANPLMCGQQKDQEGKDYHTWRLDAFRYCRKVLAYHDVIKEEKEKFDKWKAAIWENGEAVPKHRMVVCWVDADVIFQQKLPFGFENIVLPEGFAVAHLGRNKMHSETGFMAVDATHAKMNLFLMLYWGLYATGAFTALREWHDCYIFDHALALSTTPAYNLSKDPESLYPFDSSVLSNWMTHHKGPARKAAEYGVQAESEGAEDER